MNQSNRARLDRFGDWETPMGREIVRTSPKNVRVEVHEHRAPTDESIRLAEEYREKARTELIGHFDLKANGFEAKAFTWYDGPTHRHKTRVVFALAGDKYDWSFDHDAFLDPGERVAKLRAEIADRLTVALMPLVVHSTLNQL